MSEFVPQLTRALADAFRPLADALGDPASAAALLRQVGVDVEVDQAVIDELERLAPSLVRVRTELVPVVDALLGGAEPSVADAALVAEIVAEVVADLDELGSPTGSIDLSGLPSVLQDRGTWTDLATSLPAALIGTWIEASVPGLYAPLRLGGVIDQWYDPAGWRRRNTDWARLSALTTDLRQGLLDAIDWAQDPDLIGLMAALRDVAAALDVPLVWTNSISPQRPVWYPDRLPVGVRALELAAETATTDVAGRFGVEVLPIPSTPGQLPTGLGLTNLSSVAGDVTVPISDTWSIVVTGGLDATGAPIIEWFPGQPPSLVDTSAPLIDVGIELRGEPSEPWLLVGSSDGPRLTLAGLAVNARLVGPPTDLALEVGLSALGDGLALELPGGSGDSFVRSAMGGNEAGGGVTFGLTWAGDEGLQLDGSAELRRVFRLGSGSGSGPLTVDELVVALVLAQELRVELGLTVAVDIGPFAAGVEGFGLAVVASADAAGNGAVGPFDLGLELVAPHTIWFELDAGAVSGEGYVSRDGDRYIGGLSLDVLVVGIDAFTIIDTSLPGDPDGFALFASLSLRFPSIPLGFGFSLSGLGGLLALNRSIDTDALALGLRSGAADAILFPDDIVNDADLLVGQIDEYFPILVGNTVVGPVAEIRWGVGDLLVGQLGVVISMPQELIVVLGSVEIIVPTREAPVLELHLDTLGAIDLANGDLLVVASLYDSRLLGVIELSGDAAVYVSWGSNPYFVVSVGGFHPGFSPPAHVPAILDSLRPMRAEVAIGLGVTAAVEAYFAVTSNTVQFGGGVEIEAEAKFLGVTYTARGWFEFDVLIRFSPFLIMADMSAGVGVFANDKELLGVSLAVHLEGPEPWFASGNARFTFFGIKVKFDFSVGGHAPPEVAPTTDVLDLVRAELANPAAWSAERGVGSLLSGLTFTGEDDSFLRPDDVLVGRQSVAPLGRHLDRFGETTPLQDEVSIVAADLVTVTDGVDGPSIGDVTDTEVDGFFAPAQFDQMSDQARLSSPSYEEMVAGVSLGSAGVGLPDGDRLVAPAGHETEIWTPDGSSRFEGVMASRDRAELIADSPAAVAVRAKRGPEVDLASVSLGPVSYVTVDALSGKVLSGPEPYSAALARSATAGTRVTPASAAVLEVQ